MTEYAISLYFDDITSKQLLELMHIAADSCGSDYMLEPKLMPPHITVCYFTTDDIAAVEKLINIEIDALKRGSITWPSLGSFVPTVLFAAPTLNEYMMDMCIRFDNLLADSVSFSEYYKPYKWMPHTTLATKLTTKQLNVAFAAVVSRFKPFKGTTSALSLASCEPFTDIHVWQLED